MANGVDVNVCLQSDQKDKVVGSQGPLRVFCCGMVSPWQSTIVYIGPRSWKATRAKDPEEEQKGYEKRQQNLWERIITKNELPKYFCYTKHLTHKTDTRTVLVFLRFLVQAGLEMKKKSRLRR